MSDPENYPPRLPYVGFRQKTSPEARFEPLIDGFWQPISDPRGFHIKTPVGEFSRKKLPWDVFSDPLIDTALHLFLVSEVFAKKLPWRTCAGDRGGDREEGQRDW